MAEYPYIDLPEPLLVSKPVYAEYARVISTTETPGQALFVTFEIGGITKEIQLLTEETYFTEWEDQTVLDGILAYLEAAHEL